MEIFILSSTFKSLPLEIFYYPALNNTSAPTIILLKGLFGLHVAKSNSWDNDFIKSSVDTFNIICINSARFGSTNEDRSSKEAFLEKTFSEECADIEKAIHYITELKKTSLNKVHIIGNSFGGTTLLGLPELLQKVASITMIGSGCGKSKTTTKPLVQTLYDEETLLKAISKYRGLFTFINGANDSVVPKESQEKIIQNAINSKVRTTHTISNANHDLSATTLTEETVDRTKLLISIIKQNIELINQ